MTDAKPGIFVATPAYGGMVHYSYTQSLVKTFAWSVQEKVPLGIFMLGNESCISRGRNTLAHEFLKSGLSKLLFIDADLQWQAPDVALLWQSEHRVVGGTYPIKKLPISINVNPLAEHTKHFPTEQRTLAQFRTWADAEASPSGDVPVRHLPNGFMMIDRSVLTDLAPLCEQYDAIDMRTGNVEKHIEFFCMGAKRGKFITEDWYISEKVLEVNCVPHLQTKIVLPHTGTHTYGVTE